MTEATKTCPDCGETKPLHAFEHQRNVCRPCRLDRQRHARERMAEPRNARCPETGKYLHMSGEHLTDSTAWRWKGDTHQFGNLAQRSAVARGLVLVPVVK